MKAKYRIILDTSSRKRILMSRRVYKLNTILGDRLVREGRAEVYIEPKNIKFVRADGQVLYLTRSEFNKLKKDTEESSNHDLLSR